MPETPILARAPEQRVGSFILLERIASGGLGEVWKARDSRLNRVVALKFILGGRHKLSAKDLLREARAASALNHPNIVTILEVGETGDDPYIAMEFVEGETLRARMVRGISLDEIVRIQSQVSLGLAAAHARGIVHRDLKPENIMLRVDNFVKLVDFGLAKVLPWTQNTTQDEPSAQSITELGQIVGTVAYMSPEQVRGQRVEPASDVFSFGIVTYELLTGRHPFRGETSVDTINAITTKEPDSVVKVRPDVPVPISDLVTRCLRKNPADRFTDATEISARLDPSALGISSAGMPRSSERRWSARGLKIAGITGVLILLLAVAWFFFGSGSGSGRESAQASVRSVAVMNLKVSGDAAASGFSEELVQELGSALKAKGLLVTARSTVGGLDPAADAKSLGAKLQVHAVLQGEIRTTGNGMRLYLELVDARTGFQIWSKTTSVDAAALVGGATDTATQIADQIGKQLKEQE